MQETLVWSLGWEDPLEKGMATHSSILAWRTPWAEEPGGLQSMGSQRVKDTTEPPAYPLQPPHPTNHQLWQSSVDSDWGACVGDMKSGGSKRDSARRAERLHE